MKKIGLVALFALLLAGCDDGGEKKAQENLRKAEAALEKENDDEIFYGSVLCNAAGLVGMW